MKKIKIELSNRDGKEPVPFCHSLQPSDQYGDHGIENSEQ